MIKQIEFTLRAYPRGVHLVTGDVMRELPELPECGLLNLLIKHTSAALALNENADPDVRHDLNAIFNRLVPENAPFYLHTDEGSDDMPSHAKSVLVGSVAQPADFTRTSQPRDMAGNISLRVPRLWRSAKNRGDNHFIELLRKPAIKPIGLQN